MHMKNVDRSLKVDTHPNEPDFKTACGWWSEHPNKWTPIGWRYHMQRFNVMWNSIILAEPAMSRRTAQWGGQGASSRAGTAACRAQLHRRIQLPPRGRRHGATGLTATGACPCRPKSDFLSIRKQKNDRKFTTPL
jgi:hypothetical protein